LSKNSLKVRKPQRYYLEKNDFCSANPSPDWNGILLYKIVRNEAILYKRYSGKLEKAPKKLCNFAKKKFIPCLKPP
jgi:hypothetical protein